VSVLSALDHGIVVVRDLDAAAATYAKFFGRAPSGRGEHPELGTANASWRLSNSYLELLSPVAAGGFADSLRARLDRVGEGPLGLAFATADAAGCARALRERGLAASDPVAGFVRETRTGRVGRWQNVYLPAEASRGVLVFAIQYLEHATDAPSNDEIAMAAGISGIDHVVVRTEAPDAAIRFFGEQLGLRLALDKTFEQWGARLLFFRVGGVTVEIAAPAKPVATPSDGDSFWGISWRTPDVVAARTRLVAEGFDVSELRSGRRPGTQVCTVRAETHGVATLLLGPAPA
jgi:catechol 2,3-dioxygenase-like lactoylglutathione lyase family enzyme